MCLHETKTCGRCNAPFECKVGNITQCQCSGVRLSDEDKRYIAANYADCLCRGCLLAIQKELKHRLALEKIDRLQSALKAR